MPLDPRMCLFERDPKVAEKLKTDLNGRKGWLEVLRSSIRSTVISFARKVSGARLYPYARENSQEGGRFFLIGLVT